MVDIVPFRGVRYTTGDPEELSQLLAPPYDMISEKQRRVLAKRSSHNIVHLVLPRSAQHAAKLMELWQWKGILKRDKDPSFYVLHQTFTWEGKKENRYGLIALVRIESPETANILPHEHTFPKPQGERLTLLQATRSNLDCIFSIFEDPKRKIEKMIKKSPKRKRVAKGFAPDGTECEFIQIPAGRFHKKLIDAFKGRRLLIADGHHRYEAARQYRDKQMVGRLPFQNLAHDYIMMYLLPNGSQGLHLLPYHRVVRDLSDNQIPTFLRALEDYFHIEPIPFDKKTQRKAWETLQRKVGQGGGKETRFGLSLADQNAYLLLRLRKRASLENYYPAKQSRDLKNLDVNILRYLVFDHLLGLGNDYTQGHRKVLFYTDADEALEELHRKRAQMLFLLKPVSVATVFKIAKNGEMMPQKSTNFYPKVPTGFCIRRMI